MDNRSELLVHVSELYYQQNLSQSQIAGILGISRPTVSRLLDEARESGVVEIIVHSPILKNPSLATVIRNEFNLREVIVISGSYGHDTALARCCEATANFLTTIMDNNTTLGITWGRAIQYISNAIKPKEYYNVNVVQMAGCLGSGNPNIDGLELALRISKKFNGTYSNIFAPVYVDNKFVHDYLLSTPQIKATLKQASKVDIAITGIGTLEDPQGSLFLAGCYTQEEYEEVHEKGAVGHILARMLDIRGNELFFKNHYPISAPLESVRTADWSIGVCASAAKAAATLATIRGKYINTLIVDEPLAMELLRLNKKTV